MALGLASGTTVNFTWGVSAVTVAITPTGGATTTIATTDKGATNLIADLLSSIAATGSPVTNVARKAAAAGIKIDGNKHVE